MLNALQSLEYLAFDLKKFQKKANWLANIVFAFVKIYKFDFQALSLSNMQQFLCNDLHGFAAHLFKQDRFVFFHHIGCFFVKMTYGVKQYIFIV